MPILFHWYLKWLKIYGFLVALPWCICLIRMYSKIRNTHTRAHICMAENSNSNNNKQTDRVAWKGWKRKSDWFVVGNKSTEERTYMLSCMMSVLRYPSAMSTFESRLHLNRSPFQYGTLTRPHIHSYYKSISTLWFPHSTHNVVACYKRIQIYQSPARNHFMDMSPILSCQ